MEFLTFDPHISDPPLLANHTTFKSFTTSRYTYPKVRIFFREHAKADELYRSNGPLPLLVFIPGLGGSVAQFHPLLSSLVDLAPCLSMDHPGGGRSDFEPKDWEAYTPEALTELLETIIEEHRDKEADQTVVLIGHSMGTAYSAYLANPSVPHKTSLSDYVVGLVGICPLPGPLSEQTTLWARRLMWVPGWVFDLWRTWDGIGGPSSPSITRFVGEEAEEELRILQWRYNKQSRTPVWRRMFYGALPVYVDGKPQGGIGGLDVWKGVKCPVYLIAAENDNLTPPKDMQKILEALKGRSPPSAAPNDALAPAAAAPVNDSTRPSDHVPQSIGDLRDEDFLKVKKPAEESFASTEDPFDDPSTPQETPADIPPQPRHPKQVIQSFTMPAPATHAVLYMPKCARAMAGLISDFLGSHVTSRLSLAWQLQYLSKEGKWDVKNLNKWKSVNPVSEAIGPERKPIFRAMKTLREADDVHCPAEFVSNWATTIKDVVDISKDQPVYDPRGLERSEIIYHKFPTVSKVPPPASEVEAFIKLIDQLRERQNGTAEADREGEGKQAVIGVHCHYGFNRTGYFIVCYLVERCGFGVKDAIEHFAMKRPNGIRHSHFLDRLHVRYNVETAQ